ncbi:MAG: hypothetical protein JW829_11290 [Pirellulales bacterium]|nr:hypothetical protein [Pirellulales bacterium]
MFASIKVKIDKALYYRLANVAKIGGYSSTDELITHILEKEISRFDEAEDDAEVRKQLRGLGYIE